MTSLYVASAGPAGKTAVCVGLGRKLLEKGKKAGYFKPVSLGAQGATECQDCASVAQALELQAEPKSMCPFVLTKEQLAQNLNGKAAEFEARLKQAFEKAAAGAAVVLIESLSGIGSDDIATRAASRAVELFNARAIIVARYAPGISAASLAASGKALGNRWLGVVVTGVPQAKLARITADIKASFTKEGVKVLGVLPEDRTLYGISVAELAGLLGAQVLSGKASKMEGVVENIMVGALNPDSGLEYYGRKANKAAVIHSNRADMALAALQTPTACLILTGGTPPPAVVTLEAEKKGVPVLLVKQDSPTALADIEKALPQACFRGPRKYDRIEEVMAKNFDFDGLFKELGV